MYREVMRLRIPVTATSLIPSLPVPRTKLPRAALTALGALAVQWEVLGLSSPPPAGGASRPHAKHKSRKTSPPACRR